MSARWPVTGTINISWKESKEVRRRWELWEIFMHEFVNAAAIRVADESSIAAAAKGSNQSELLRTCFQLFALQSL
ncbi:hypothetical protein Q1695_006402 [Nippostrongylus brasiliensis]|nr:hypothetical protein Q1695_006402 [Nippostrongylus brasiliensis]